MTNPHRPSLRQRCLIPLVLLGLWCGATTAEAAPALRVSLENRADHIQTRMVKRFADAVRAKTQGRLALKIYHSAQLYRGRDAIQALSQGKIEMAFPGTWQLDRFAPNIGLLQYPLFYGQPRTAIYRVVDGPIGQRLNRELERATHSRVLGRWIDLGAAHIFTIKQAIDSYEDLAGLKIRIPGGRANAFRIQQLGMEPVVIPWPDLREALERRRVDGFISTYATVANARLWQAGVRYVFADHQYFAQYVPLINAQVWRQLAPDLRQALQAAWDDTVTFARAAAQQEQERALATLRQHGVRVFRPSTTQLNQQRQRLLQAQSDGWPLPATIDKSLLDAILRRLGADTGHPLP